ncbi:hypothetical protein BDV30DRAFT_203568 [Aspergillus minisclerotigenes]|uniref:Uncharacterized protein n=1 Tax=Aspergillus minisclerotigenes TaxID=656917 RepID=A0A5N6JIM5_9EURO|nr:hypothetical protein BDV30DRAFT_203568 [Aspergillus minisclerotigenes]
MGPFPSRVHCLSVCQEPLDCYNHAEWGVLYNSSARADFIWQEPPNFSVMAVAWRPGSHLPAPIATPFLDGAALSAPSPLHCLQPSGSTGLMIVGHVLDIMNPCNIATWGIPRCQWSRGYKARLLTSLFASLAMLSINILHSYLFKQQSFISSLTVA